ncbi:hypothetical protein GCG21_00465 [Pseudactinotalea sp. HY160]|uniref:hypothetical protein n=1 Tax=Pseudactinotalea sp. HY160 TaxID=2654490 RepID=UPI00128CF8E8|nr:hypothetical protein [Pseudactinotalea sp. HY160]MPV48506.1 hypothetical protein [Pseudactinotalea sp. HY160]
MDVWRITLAALRRWYILIPLLALTGWAAVSAGHSVHPEYEVDATAMLTPGQAEATIPNPYGSLNDANQAVGIVLNSAESHAAIAAQGLSTDYVVTPETRSSIMRLTVRADDADTAIATGAAVLDLATSELAARQQAAGVAKASRFGIAVLAPPSVLDVVYDGRTRIQAIVGLLGASVALVVAVLFDDIVGLVRRRRGLREDRRDRREAPAVAPAASAPVDPADPDDSGATSPAGPAPGVATGPIEHSPARPSGESAPDPGRELDLSGSSWTDERR